MAGLARRAVPTLLVELNIQAPSAPSRPASEEVTQKSARRLWVSPAGVPGGDRTVQAVQGLGSTSRALPCARRCSQSLVLLLGFFLLLWVIHRQPLGLKGGHPAFWDRTRRLWPPRASQAWAASALPHPSAEGHGCCCLLPASLRARAAFSAWGGKKGGRDSHDRAFPTPHQLRAGHIWR